MIIFLFKKVTDPLTINEPVNTDSVWRNVILLPADNVKTKIKPQHIKFQKAVSCTLCGD